jgi:hypothetical protein
MSQCEMVAYWRFQAAISLHFTALMVHVVDMVRPPAGPKTLRLCVETSRRRRWRQPLCKAYMALRPVLLPPGMSIYISTVSQDPCQPACPFLQHAKHFNWPNKLSLLLISAAAARKQIAPSTCAVRRWPSHIIVIWAVQVPVHLICLRRILLWNNRDETAS